MTHEFSTSYKHGDDVEDVTTFSGGLVLPTRLQVFELHLFFKDEAGRGNQHVTPGQITGKVDKVVKTYWKLAGFDTVFSKWKKIAKLLDDYKDQLKKRNMQNKGWRSKFLLP